MLPEVAVVLQEVAEVDLVALHGVVAASAVAEALPVAAVALSEVVAVDEVHLVVVAGGFKHELL